MLIAPVSVRRDAALLKERAVKARPCIVYLLLERRNAWHSTTLNQYSSSAPLFSSFHAARSAAESRRKAGSYFVIADKPALTFDFEMQSLVVVDLNTSKPFAKWALPPAMADRKSPVSADEVLRAFSESYFGQQSSGWNVRGSDPTVVIGVAESKALSPYVEETTFTRRASYIQSGLMLYSSGAKEDIDSSALLRLAWLMGQRGLTEARADLQRLRVIQLAAQLQVDTKTVRDLLEQIGAPAKGPRSWVEPQTVEEMRLRFLPDAI